MNNDYDYLFKILLLGDSGVGKSSLLIRYIDDNYDEHVNATIGVDYRIKILNLHDKNIKLQLWDTSGQEKFKSITKAYYRGTHGVIVLYETSDRNSFNNVKTWIDEIREISEIEDIPIILVGNKIDLKTRKEVLYEEGKEFADEMNVEFFEISAKDNINIDDVFIKLSNEIKNHELIKELYYKKVSINKSSIVLNSNIMSCDGCKGNNCC
jgi:Ras-related protein Rab-1A